MLLDPELPWQVRDNVDVLMRRIDAVEGYARFSVSIVSDSNPRNLSGQREFTIAGVRLTFVPSGDNKRVTGVRYVAQAMCPLDAPSRLSTYFTGSYLDYPNITFDRLTVDLGLAKGLDSAGRASLRGGVEAGTFGGHQLYEFPYFAFAYVLSQSAVQRVTGEARFGSVNFPDFGLQDATYASMAIATERSVANTLALGFKLAVERANAADAAFSYTGESLGPTASWLIVEPALLVKAEFAFAKRDYGAPDPFFGAQRADRKTRVDVSLRSKRWRLFNFNPAFLVGIERNRSSLGFYEYEKVNVSLTLE